MNESEKKIVKVWEKKGATNMAKEGEEGSNDFGKWRSNEVKMLFVETEERKQNI